MKSFSNSVSFNLSDSEDLIKEKLLGCCSKDVNFFKHLKLAFARLFRDNFMESPNFKIVSQYAHEIFAWKIERIEWSWKTGLVSFYFHRFISKGYIYE